MASVARKNLTTETQRCTEKQSPLWSSVSSVVKNPLWASVVKNIAQFSDLLYFSYRNPNT